jgi:hypothetical protein
VQAGRSSWAAVLSCHPGTLATRKDSIAVFVTSPASLSAERALMTEPLEKL